MARKKADSPMATANVVPGTQEHFADWLKDNPGKDMPDYQAAYPQVVQEQHVSATAMKNPSDMGTEEYAAWRAAQPEPTAPPPPPMEGGRQEAPPTVPPPPLPASNGHTTRPKAPRSTFYLVIGITKDGSAMDVLGRYETGNQARKALAAMRMAIARSYTDVNVFQCRDKTEAQ